MEAGEHRRVVVVKDRTVKRRAGGADWIALRAVGRIMVDMSAPTNARRDRFNAFQVKPVGGQKICMKDRERRDASSLSPYAHR